MLDKKYEDIMQPISSALVNRTYYTYKELQKAHAVESPKIIALWKKELTLLSLACKTDPDALNYLGIKYSLEKVGTPDIEDILAIEFTRLDAERGLSEAPIHNVQRPPSIIPEERPNPTFGNSAFSIPRRSLIRNKGAESLLVYEKNPG